MTRGFVTIATGREHYYKLASNLLLSYRFFSASPYPFAIIAEEDNQYTSQFDDVIITHESTHSFMDKFLLLKLCPYDETIFIDADCLAYGDLNRYWTLFDGATDFSAIGINVPRDQREGVWYNVEDIGEYGSRISYKVRVHSGVCFIRRSERILQLYHDCIDLSDHYGELTFHTCPESRDECILGVAMPLNEMKAVRAGDLLATYPLASILKADILHGRLQYETQWQGFIQKGTLLHWGTTQTFSPLYIFESACLKYMIRRGEKRPNIFQMIWYERKLLYGVLLLRSIYLRIIKRAKHITRYLCT